MREHLAARLPHYMVPAQIVTLDALPLTPNGKIDLKKLPSPERLAIDTNGFVEAEGETEKTLAAIWRDVLDIQRIGAEDNIFDLGADSLSATRAFARMNTALGTEISLKDVFEHPTIRTLARIAQTTVSQSRRGPIKAQPRRSTAMTA